MSFSEDDCTVSCDFGVECTAADEAAERLQLSRRQVYILIDQIRCGSGTVTDLLIAPPSGGRGGPSERRGGGRDRRSCREGVLEAAETQRRGGAPPNCVGLSSIRISGAGAQYGGGTDRGDASRSSGQVAWRPGCGAAAPKRRRCPSARGGGARARADRSHRGGSDDRRRARPRTDRTPV